MMVCGWLRLAGLCHTILPVKGQGSGHFDFFKALRSKIGSCAPAYGSKEKSGLSMFYDPSKLGSGTSELVP